MTTPARLENWHTTTNGTPYQDPATARLLLSGKVYGHPKGPHLDGRTVTTSPIVSVDGRKVTTASGSVYVLGRPKRAWLAYLKQIGKPYDPKAPIKVISSPTPESK